MYLREMGSKDEKNKGDGDINMKDRGLKERCGYQKDANARN